MGAKVRPSVGITVAHQSEQTVAQQHVRLEHATPDSEPFPVKIKAQTTERPPRFPENTKHSMKVITKTRLGVKSCRCYGNTPSFTLVMQTQAFIVKVWADVLCWAHWCSLGPQQQQQQQCLLSTKKKKKEKKARKKE